MAAAVLFLDVAWRPLRVEPWERAITDFFLGKVEVIEYSRDHTIQGATRAHPMPSVVRLLRDFKREKIRIKFSRVNIYARDGFVCQYCGQRRMTEDLTFDHVQPRSRGGKTSWENIVTCCVECNAKKSNRTPEEAGLRLLSRPRKPRYLPAVTMRDRKGFHVPEEWKPYWTSVLEG